MNNGRECHCVFKTPTRDPVESRSTGCHRIHVRVPPVWVTFSSNWMCMSFCDSWWYSVSQYIRCPSSMCHLMKPERSYTHCPVDASSWLTFSPRNIVISFEDIYLLNKNNIIQKETRTERAEAIILDLSSTPCLIYSLRSWRQTDRPAVCACKVTPGQRLLRKEPNLHTFQVLLISIKWPPSSFTMINDTTFCNEEPRWPLLERDMYEIYM